MTLLRETQQRQLERHRQAAVLGLEDAIERWRALAPSMQLRKLKAVLRLVQLTSETGDRP